MDPPVLSKAKPGEPLSLYIAARPKAVSSALVREEGGTQNPFYYISQVLKDAETRYPNLEKFASGRLVNWAIELSQFNIKFVSRTAIKAQALAEFVMQCTFPKSTQPLPREMSPERTNSGTNSWKLYVDGSSTAERSGAGLILISPEGFTIQQAITFAFKATNNQAEYEAFIAGLRLAKSLGVSRMTIHSDS
ncbi:uncharacterized protein LOC141685296 [Apium graveolens]|uniref:uncharacterized protein LOC141685296 n=1 Tax=Apium graveolens TaxID=4045 RepID=UPI003D7C013E